MDLSFGLISKRVNLAPERSYWVRSAFSTNAAAARSLLKVGIFFFIRIDLLLVHVTGAMGRMSSSSPLRRSVNTMNTPRPFVRSAYGAKAARVANGQHPGEWQA